ncbi:unnamed protein product [Rangifer tarandus platyrhynchus]|uniref:Uncharacterized protein n=2 Tax=Rangifer tarandus platyrhynchus TaxID=3082113 RepID=A0ACB0F3K1_RANTA|nr:unnamed protein product [Rangifer tarandus platyrhynchus]CAI9707585.1 unnamed protein product [Rangifer tarandus platyrhynchus]
MGLSGEEKAWERSASGKRRSSQETERREVCSATSSTLTPAAADRSAAPGPAEDRTPGPPGRRATGRSWLYYALPT